MVLRQVEKPERGGGASPSESVERPTPIPDVENTMEKEFHIIFAKPIEVGEGVVVLAEEDQLPTSLPVTSGGTNVFTIDTTQDAVQGMPDGVTDAPPVGIPSLNPDRNGGAELETSKGGLRNSADTTNVSPVDREIIFLGSLGGSALFVGALASTVFGIPGAVAGAVLGAACGGSLGWKVAYRHDASRKS